MDCLTSKSMTIHSINYQNSILIYLSISDKNDFLHGDTTMQILQDEWFNL